MCLMIAEIAKLPQMNRIYRAILLMKIPQAFFTKLLKRFFRVC